jgi:hypothetical protein
MILLIVYTGSPVSSSSSTSPGGSTPGGTSLSNKTWNTGYILIFSGSSSLYVTIPSFFLILNSPSLVWSSLLLGRFILIFFLSKKTIPPSLRSGSSDFPLFACLALFFLISFKLSISSSYIILIYFTDT